MQFETTNIPGLFLIKPRLFTDNRGAFVKIFNRKTFEQHGLSIAFKESYYSISEKNVIRGMHFQVPPHEHEKLVYVPSGGVLDVVLDIRKGSPAYGKHYTQNLNAENGWMLFIPKGCAHGFLSLKSGTNLTYLQTTTHAPHHDAGICYDSFGMTWQIKNPVISDRDRNLPKLAAFITPFSFQEGE